MEDPCIAVLYKVKEIIKMLYFSQHLLQGFFLTDTYGLSQIYFSLKFPLSVTPVTHAGTESSKTLEK